MVRIINQDIKCLEFRTQPNSSGFDAPLSTRQQNRVTGKFEETKGRCDRYVPLSESLSLELKRLVGEESSTSKALVFPSRTGGPIYHDNFYRRVFKRDLREWGGKPIRFHDLRHACFTLMVGNNVDIRTVKEIAGHQSVETTMGYVHALGIDAQKAKRLFVFDE